MKKYSSIKVVKDGSIYVIMRLFDDVWMECGWYFDKGKAIFAAESLAYCYDCKVVSITSK